MRRRRRGVGVKVETTRATAYPMRHYVYTLITTGLRLFIPLSVPGPKVAISSPTTFSAGQDIPTDVDRD